MPMHSTAWVSDDRWQPTRPLVCTHQGCPSCSPASAVTGCAGSPAVHASARNISVRSYCCDLRPAVPVRAVRLMGRTGAKRSSSSSSAMPLPCQSHTTPATAKVRKPRHGLSRAASPFTAQHKRSPGVARVYLHIQVLQAGQRLDALCGKARRQGIQCKRSSASVKDTR